MSRVFLDAGHGGKDAGAVNGKRKESDDVLRLVLRVRELLIEQGVKVYLSRTKDEYISVDDRAKMANKTDAVYFCSFHRNSFSSSTANGAEVWAYSKATASDLKKAQLLQDAMVSVGFANRGVKKGAPNYTDFGVNKYTKMVACLIEIGFISNQYDNSIFDGKFEMLAKALTKALCEIVGVEYKGNLTGATKPVDPDFPIPPIPDFKVGDIVKIKQGAVWYEGGKIPDWVYNKYWYIRDIRGDRVVLGQDPDKNYDINSPINMEFIEKANIESLKPEPPKEPEKPEEPKPEPEKPKPDYPELPPEDIKHTPETLFGKLIRLILELFSK